MAGYAHLAGDRWRGSRVRATPLAPQWLTLITFLWKCWIFSMLMEEKLSSSIGYSLTLYLRIRQTNTVNHQISLSQQILKQNGNNIV